MSRIYDIEIDESRTESLDAFSVKLLKSYYLKPEETVQEGFARACRASCGGDLELAQRLYEYVSKGWFMFSSPILSNAPRPGEPWKALPISCFLSYVPDSLDGLIDHTSELRWLSVKGGGVGGHWSSVRSVSDKSPGPIPFLKTVDADMNAYRQGKTRKGSYAAYLDISHPDIVEFINFRDPTGGDPNRKCFNLHNAVNLTDDFMQAVAEGKTWDLVDPSNGEVRETVKARHLMQRLVETRFKTGEPYLNFIDTANKDLPEALQAIGLKIHGSNLCNEIHLPTNEDRTAVCCLSSLNLEYFDEWCETLIVRDLITMLDNVLQVFIDEAPDSLSRAIYSASQERSLGLGGMGFHSYLQRNNIPWESALATMANHRIFSFIQSEAVEQTKVLAELRGCYPDSEGHDSEPRRNSHLLAIAPNANSSIIACTSPSIEPTKANAYTHRTRLGSHLVKNKYLEALLNERLPESELQAVWSEIITNGGSVQHLECLTDWEKEVFKTAFEINQEWVVQHAGDRQPYICQGQSVNLFFPAGSEKSYVMKVHLQAWKQGLKGLYYLRTSSSVDADKVSLSMQRASLADYAGSDDDECLACHG